MSEAQLIATMAALLTGGAAVLGLICAYGWWALTQQQVRAQRHRQQASQLSEEYAARLRPLIEVYMGNLAAHYRRCGQDQAAREAEAYVAYVRDNPPPPARARADTATTGGLRMTEDDIPLAMTWEQCRVRSVIRERDNLLALLRRHNDALREALEEAATR